MSDQPQNLAPSSSVALVPMPAGQPVRSPLAFEPASFDDAWRMSQLLAQSQLLPKHLRGKPHDVMVTITYGHELGLSPMQAMLGVYVVEGKPGVSAQIAVALVKRRRDLCEYFRLIESTEKVARYVTKRVGDQEVPMSFSWDEAVKAELVNKDNWRRYPAAMLRNRCSMHLARDVYPDLVANIYDTDEVAMPLSSSPGGSEMYTLPFPPPVAPIPAPPAPEAAASTPSPAPASEAPGTIYTDAVHLENLLTEARTEAALEALVPSVRHHAGEDKAHRVRLLYNGAYRRVRGLS